MIVSLVVPTFRPLRDMAVRKTIRHPVSRELAAGDLLLEVVQERKVGVWNKVCVPDGGESAFFDPVLCGGKVVRVAIKLI